GAVRGAVAVGAVVVLDVVIVLLLVFVLVSDAQAVAQIDKASAHRPRTKFLRTFVSFQTYQIILACFRPLVRNRRAMRRLGRARWGSSVWREKCWRACASGCGACTTKVQARLLTVLRRRGDEVGRDTQAALLAQSSKRASTTEPRLAPCCSASAG